MHKFAALHAIVLETEQSQHPISTHILLMPNLKLYSAESLENMITFSTLTLCISFQDLFCMFTFHGCWQCNLQLILEWIFNIFTDMLSLLPYTDILIRSWIELSHFFPCKIVFLSLMDDHEDAKPFFLP